jgi:hypothetical protein
MVTKVGFQMKPKWSYLDVVVIGVTLEYEIRPRMIKLSVGETVRLSLHTPFPYESIRWVVDPQGIATISGDGELKAIAVGKAKAAAFVDDRVLVVADFLVV